MKFLVTSIKYLKYFVDLLKTRKISYNQICEENKSNFLINFFILEIIYLFFFCKKSMSEVGHPKCILIVRRFECSQPKCMRVHSKKTTEAHPQKTKKKKKKKKKKKNKKKKKKKKEKNRLENINRPLHLISKSFFSCL